MEQMKDSKVHLDTYMLCMGWHIQLHKRHSLYA